MRTIKFLDHARQRAQLNRGVLSPHVRANWPICMTCGREVDAVDLKNINRTSVEIWARHHGAEDFYRVEFPFPLDGDPLDDDRNNWALQRAMKDGSFFDPTRPAK